jgi:tetratricopeptide (TPR) repeat protein
MSYLHCGSFSLGLLLFPLAVACVTQPALPLVKREAPVVAWLEEGERLAQQGQGLRAEEYLRAAWDAGAPAERVAPLLVELCVESGRLQSALVYVERARRETPHHPQMIQLSASLLIALGQEKRARLDVMELERLSPNYPEALYFLGEYLLEQGESARGTHYLESYLRRWPYAARVPWVRHLLMQVGPAGSVTPELSEGDGLGEPTSTSAGGASSEGGV